MHYFRSPVLLFLAIMMTLGEDSVLARCDVTAIWYDVGLVHQSVWYREAVDLINRGGLRFLRIG